MAQLTPLKIGSKTPTCAIGFIYCWHFVLKMAESLKYWTKTSGKTGNSKMHLSGDDLQPFCGLDTYYYEFGGKAIEVSEKGLGAEYTQGTSVYQRQAYQDVPSEMICKKCLKRALAK